MVSPRLTRKRLGDSRELSKRAMCRELPPTSLRAVELEGVQTKKATEAKPSLSMVELEAVQTKKAMKAKAAFPVILAATLGRAELCTNKHIQSGMCILILKTTDIYPHIQHRAGMVGTLLQASRFSLQGLPRSTRLSGGGWEQVKGHSGNIRGTFTEHSGNIRGTFSAPPAAELWYKRTIVRLRSF
jgi:hypothetical protein